MTLAAKIRFEGIFTDGKTGVMINQKFGSIFISCPTELIRLFCGIGFYALCSVVFETGRSVIMKMRSNAHNYLLVMFDSYTVQ